MRPAAGADVARGRPGGGAGRRRAGAGAGQRGWPPVALPAARPATWPNGPAIPRDGDGDGQTDVLVTGGGFPSAGAPMVLRARRARPAAAVARRRPRWRPRPCRHRPRRWWSRPRHATGGPAGRPRCRSSRATVWRPIPRATAPANAEVLWFTGARAQRLAHRLHLSDGRDGRPDPLPRDRGVQGAGRLGARGRAGGRNRDLRHARQRPLHPHLGPGERADEPFLPAGGDARAVSLGRSVRPPALRGQWGGRAKNPRRLPAGGGGSLGRKLAGCQKL